MNLSSLLNQSSPPTQDFNSLYNQITDQLYALGTVIGHIMPAGAVTPAIANNMAAGLISHLFAGLTHGHDQDINKDILMRDTVKALYALAAGHEEYHRRLLHIIAKGEKAYTKRAAEDRVFQATADCGEDAPTNTRAN